MTATDPRSVAARLGVDVAIVRRLQARGSLRRFELTSGEIRERLYRAHLASLQAQTRRRA